MDSSAKSTTTTTLNGHANGLVAPADTRGQVTAASDTHQYQMMTGSASKADGPLFSARNHSSESTLLAPVPRPQKRFDPFLPLDDNADLPRTPLHYLPPPPDLPTAATESGALYPTSTPSIVRDHRPKSLYLPLEEPNTSTWPFVAEGDGAGSLLNAPPSAIPTPYSPSLINPIYAEPPTPMPPPPPPHAPPIVGIALSLAQRISAHASPSPSLNSAASRPAESHSPIRHHNTHSIGTHSLLAPRTGSLSSASLAAKMDSPTAWLILYFSFNLGLTLFNKLVLQGFPFPWTLTGIQMLSGTIGTQIALERGYFVQARLTTRETGILVAFSVLYTVNIAVSNLSLQLVTVPFHQVIRAMTPLFTIILSALLLRKRHSRSTYLSLVPVVIGVIFATYGDYYFTAWGFILTLIGTFLAAVKTIVTNRIQVGRLKLHPLDLLIRMSPLAFLQCVLCAWYSGEMDKVRVYGATEMTKTKAIALLVNGVIAFGLNVVSFTANKKTSALTMTVAANVKQVLTIILAVIIFNLSLSMTNLFGITLTLAGGAWYAKVELQEKSNNRNATALSNARLTPSDLKSPGLGGSEK